MLWWKFEASWSLAFFLVISNILENYEFVDLLPSHIKHKGAICSRWENITVLQTPKNVASTEGSLQIAFTTERKCVVMASCHKHSSGRRAEATANWKGIRVGHRLLLSQTVVQIFSESSANLRKLQHMETEPVVIMCSPGSILLFVITCCVQE